jgi:hypothetical protein
MSDDGTMTPTRFMCLHPEVGYSLLAAEHTDPVEHRVFYFLRTAPGVQYYRITSFIPSEAKIISPDGTVLSA